MKIKDSSPLPPPFNIVPSLEPLYDIIFYVIGWRKTMAEIPVDRSKRKVEQQRRKLKYQKVIQKLVRRYVQQKVSLEQAADVLRENDLHDLQVELSAFKVNKSFSFLSKQFLILILFLHWIFEFLNLSLVLTFYF